MCVVPPAHLCFIRFNGNVYQVYVRKRPYLDYFLETVSKSFEVHHAFISVYVVSIILCDMCAGGGFHGVAKGVCRRAAGPDRSGQEVH